MAQESCNIDKDEAEVLKSAPSASTPPSPAAASPPPLFPKPPVKRAESEPKDQAPRVDSETMVAIGTGKIQEIHAPICRSISRCSNCQKRVGLTGFRCRCGELFCGQHRYSDAHDCSFDYKTAGREAISKANPVVRAAKIIKI